MAKPYIHSQSSARKYGGIPADYEKIHEWFDQTKAFLPDQRHRAILHSSFGIFLCTQVFGNTIINTDGKIVSVRDIGEQHVLEDFGGRFIPTAQDYLQEIEYKEWMQNGKECPPSFQKVNKRRNRKKEEAKVVQPFPSVAGELNVTDGMLRTPFKLPETLPSGEDIVADGSRRTIPALPGMDKVYDGSLNRHPNPTID